MNTLLKLKKNIAFVCTALLCFGLLSGCGESQPKKEEIVKQSVNIDGYEVFEDELMVYCLLQLLSGTVTYSDVLMSESEMKEYIITTIRANKILYNMAKEEGLEFTSDDINTRNQLVTSFKSYIPEEVFEKYGITDETIQKVFEETTYVQKFENDKRNEIGKQLNEDYLEKYKDYNFQNLYYVMFPAVCVDEDNAPVKDEEGNYIPLSDEEKQEKENQAKEYALAVNEGEDAKNLAKDYGVDIYSSEQAGYVGAYPDELNEVLASLEVGQCTEVYESNTGYYVIVVLSNHDEDLLESYAYTLAYNEVDSAYAANRELWLAKTATDTDAVLEESFWGSFSLVDMAADLVERGLLQ